MSSKVKKIALIGIMMVIMLAVLTMAMPNTVNAVTLPMYLGITEIRTNDTPNLGYAIGDPNTNGETGESNKIWNIVEYTGLGSDASLKADGAKNIYCLKAGIGFTNTHKRDEYTMSFNMKTQRDTIAETSDVLRSIVEGTVPYKASSTATEVQVSKYNSILALGDMLYLISDDENQKAEYLKAAGINAEEWDTVLTRDEIAAVQQAAFWYFTNYEEGKTTFDKTGADTTGWLWYTENGTTYQNLIQHNPTGVAINDSYGAQRQQQAEILYRYLIQTAKKNSTNYANPETTTVPASLTTTSLGYKEVGNNYVLGPINITETEGNTIPYDIEFAFKANGSTIDEDEYTLLNASEQPVSEGTTIKDLVGENFYISVPKTKGKTFSVATKIKYSNSVLNLYTAPGNTTQPVLIPEKEPEEVPAEISVEIEVEEAFDLKLIKRIFEVNDKKVPERIEGVDVSKLNTTDENGNKITTGDYTLNKKPYGVKKGDIVTYALRVYNEGTIDGYASEITEDIPEGLEFLWMSPEDLEKDTTLTAAEKEAIEFNQKYLWGKFVYDEETKDRIVQISTDYLSKENETTTNGNLIKAFGENDGTKTEKDISYKEVYVKMKVVSEDTTGTIIRNEAAITEDTDSENNPVNDRDSDTEVWKKYEDDEDYDNITLEVFDLALRKFIIAVSKDETIENSEYLRNEDGSYKRAPIVDTSKLNTIGEDEKRITTATYNHTKEPVLVQRNDIVVYMLRVYNEGDIDGYAAEIKDHLPPHLEFVDSEFNKQYGWDVSEDGRTVTTTYLSSEDSLIKKAVKDDNDEYVLSYKEVPIMCKVVGDAPTNQNITNIADITKYEDYNKEPVADRDSQENNVELPKPENLPTYKDNEKGEYVPGQQDDDDFEKVIVKEFDLALRKWVTQAIVTDKKGTVITNTGHQPYDDPEDIVKVELDRKKLNEVTVKFRYSIRVINEGDLEGYAKEVTDYIPEGLKFVAADNPGWTDEGNNVISTRLLENKLLKPGEYADVEVLLTWVNNQNNMGLKVNTAEISEDYNEYDVPDKDSTPDNKKPGEDDIDDAPVMLSIKTGQTRIYFTLGFTILITIAGGIVLIKKYVL